MKLVLSALLLLAPLALQAQADLPAAAIEGAVIVRVDNRDQSMSIATTGEKLVSPEQAALLTSNLTFSTVSQDQQLGELDREAGASSWYCYYTPSWSYLYWYGSYYQPFYTYNYSYYSYTYYNSYGWWRW